MTNLFKYNEMVEVFYEDLSGYRIRELKRISSFLNVKYLPMNSELCKQNPRKVNQIISNYQDFSKQLKQTKWKVFLD